MVSIVTEGQSMYWPQFCFIVAILFSNDCLYSQNAGAVIGKGGKNIKALRTDVSTFILHTMNFNFVLFFPFALAHSL